MLFSSFRARTLAVGAALVLVFPVLIAACGGESSVTSSTPTPGRPQNDTSSSDAAYMKAVCTAANDAAGPVITKISSDTSLINDQQKLLAALTPAITDLAQKLSDIQPPADLKTYHEQIVQQLQQVAGKAKSGQLRASAISPGWRTVNPSQDVQDRVNAAAADIPECQQSPSSRAASSAAARVAPRARVDRRRRAPNAVTRRPLSL